MWNVGSSSKDKCIHEDSSDILSRFSSSTDVQSASFDFSLRLETAVAKLEGSELETAALYTGVCSVFMIRPSLKFATETAAVCVTSVRAKLLERTWYGRYLELGLADQSVPTALQYSQNVLPSSSSGGAGVGHG